MNATTQATFDELRGGFAKASPGRDPLTPPAQGLYDPSKEHDSCGVGFVADMKNRKSHDILEKGLQILINLDHRGAVGADPVARRRLRRADPNPASRSSRRNAPSSASTCRRRAITRSASSSCRAKPRRASRCARSSRRSSRPKASSVLGWRDVPVDNSVPRRTRQGGRAGDAADFHRAPRRRRAAKTILSGGCSSSARSSPIASTRSGRRRSWNITRSRCPPAPSSTRAWCWCGSSRPITATSWTRVTRPRWRWSINGSRPTRFRPGVSRTPIAWSRTTAKSTRCAATSTGWRRVRRASIPNCSAPISRSCGRSPTKASRTPPASTTRSSSSFRAAIRSATR